MVAPISRPLAPGSPSPNQTVAIAVTVVYESKEKSAFYQPRSVLGIRDGVIKSAGTYSSQSSSMCANLEDMHGLAVCLH